MRTIPGKIMCAVDFSDFSDRVLAYGKALASEFHSRLCLCHVIPAPALVSSHISGMVYTFSNEADDIRQAREKLEEQAQALQLECDILISVGHPADEIEHQARLYQAELVIAATHGRSGVKRFLTGSVTSRLVKTLACPILVLHTGENRPVVAGGERNPALIKNILVGCDFSPDSRLAFAYALSLAQEFQTDLHLAHVVRADPQSGLGVLDVSVMTGQNLPGWTRDNIQALRKEAGEGGWTKKGLLIQGLLDQLAAMVPEESRNWCTPKTVVLEGLAYRELVRYAAAAAADLIVLGIRGYSLLEEFLIGSTTDRVLSQAACPVLVVREIP